MKRILLFVLALVIILCILFRHPVIKEQPISILSFNDLTKLSKGAKLDHFLYTKLKKQLNTPYVVNQAPTPHFSAPYIRLAQWNIERGNNLNAIKNIFSNHSAYYYNYKNNIDAGQEDKFKKEAKDFANSDIISLNEVDIGVPRTEYRNVISEIANTLNYNYAFATEFLELAPLVYKQKVNSGQFLGLHGNAILSKYPIISTRVIRLPQCYNWFDAEISRKSPLEHGRRFGAKAIFKVRINNEPRRGGRNALISDIKLPDNEIITVVSTHLEDRCFPSCRLRQIKYLLDNLKYLRRSVVIAGDFNTTTTDTAPTSVKKEITKRIKDPNFIARQAAFFLIPGFQFGVGSLAAATVRGALHYKDPAALSIPILFPNEERKLFMYLKDFQFADGENFDFSGDLKRSSNGKRGLLASSNERQLKGFESTFRLAKPMGIAYYKLDWFFVKPKRGRFLPFNGKTLQLVNEAYPGRVSDHSPITVDLSL